MLHITKEKLHRRLRGYYVRFIEKKAWRLWLYPSYWHYRLKGMQDTGDLSTLYHASYPNPAAGIGHQISNWAAELYGVKYAYYPFANKQWEELLGFGAGEITFQELRRKGWRVRRLPRIRHDDIKEAELNCRIVKSYAGKKILFLAELDQFFFDLPKLQKIMQEKYYAADDKRDNNLVYNAEHFNIAIHVRRGDILANLDHPQLKMRYLANDYYERVLEMALEKIESEKPKHIYLFSQGGPEDFPEFQRFPNLHWCMKMSAYQSFEHMVHADLLITSKSSFSYKPALLSHGIKICPPHFWHPYPTSSDWIIANNDGTF